ncbi:MAG: DUF2491 family protein [Gammaproteobacteria bacterium]|nr:DUF2491 family protein [Gammaproteobacteria bacterium]
MSMKQYLRLKVKGAKERWANRGQEEKRRVDDQLPLNLRLGSRIQFAEAPFLIAGDGTFVQYPGNETLLSAFSEVELAGLKTYRLYLDSRADPDESAMLMLIMDEAGNQVEERYLFHEQYELPLYHTTLADIGVDDDETTAVDFWLKKDEGILGMPVFHTPEEASYERLWEAERDVWLQPASVRETIVLDTYGDDQTEVEHLGTMLFARVFDGLAGTLEEYLLPTVERDQSGFRVRIWVGLPIAAADMELPDAV